MQKITLIQSAKISGLLASDYLWIGKNIYLLPSLQRQYKKYTHSLKAWTIDEDRITEMEIMKKTNIQYYTTTTATTTTTTIFHELKQDPERMASDKKDFAGKTIYIIFQSICILFYNLFLFKWRKKKPVIKIFAKTNITLHNFSNSFFFFVKYFFPLSTNQYLILKFSNFRLLFCCSRK
jgi:hypothetical protein